MSQDDSGICMKFNPHGRRTLHSEGNARPGSMPLLTEAENAPANHCRRLVILGSPKVGKTSIVKRFLYNRYDDNYTPTIEDFHRKIYRIRGEAYRLDILDTSGIHPFPAMRRLSLMTGDLFLLVFSLDSRESFDEVKRLQEQIIQVKGERPGGGGGTDGAAGATAGVLRGRKKVTVPIVVVGNKSDLDVERQVDSSDLRGVVDAVPGNACVESSAKKNQNIEEIFLKLFLLANLPTEMSPSLHRKVTPMYVGSPSPGSIRRTVTLRRRLSDACGAIAPNARRPSIRTDLLLMQMQTNKKKLVRADSEGQKDSRCTIQ